jgi:PAP2 superfamily
MPMRTQIRPDLRYHPVLAWRLLTARHPATRYAQILPVALLLWGLDDVARFRAGAASAGLHNAIVVNSISNTIGGAAVHLMNDWTVAHGAAALASTWYYILFQGAVTGIVGVVLIWRRAPHFSLQRNALIAVTLAGLVAFWLYPVAPPRMLPGYHDVIAIAVPQFTSAVESNGAAQFASLPSLHVAWALWVAIALCTVVRRPLWRAVVWLYPAATVADVLATANHYLLDVITAPGLLLVAYGIVLAPAGVRHLLHRRPLRLVRTAAVSAAAASTEAVGNAAASTAAASTAAASTAAVSAGQHRRSACTTGPRPDDADTSAPP